MEIDMELWEKKFASAKDANAALFLIKLQNSHLITMVEQLTERISKLEAVAPEVIVAPEVVKVTDVEPTKPVELEVEIEEDEIKLEVPVVEADAE